MSRDARSVRIAAQPAAEWSEQTQNLLGPPGRNKLPAVLPALAHHPTLLGPFLQWSATLALEGSLAPVDAELLALRAALLCRSEFEWAQHVEYARSADLDEAAIARVVEGPDAEEWDPRERALLLAADELVNGHEITDSTWRRLSEHFDTAQLIEIPFIVGQYTMLSMVTNALGVPIDEGQAALP